MIVIFCWNHEIENKYFIADELADIPNSIYKSLSCRPSEDQTWILNGMSVFHFVEFAKAVRIFYWNTKNHGGKRRKLDAFIRTSIQIKLISMTDLFGYHYPHHIVNILSLTFSSFYDWIVETQEGNKKIAWMSLIDNGLIPYWW